jgi:hypothetical protein
MALCEKSSGGFKKLADNVLKKYFLKSDGVLDE